MKSIQFIFAASLLLAATQTSYALEKLVAKESYAEYNTLSWVNQYYKNPQPDLLVKRVYVLSRMGYFEQEGQLPQAIGFFASIFAQHPDKLDFWFSEFRGLPAKHQRLLAAAAWTSGDPRGAALLQRTSGTNKQALAELLAHKPGALTETAVLSTSSMNLHWGAFLASGDERHIISILAAVGAQTPGIAESARLSLAMNAAQDERVLAICRAQLDKQPNSVRELLRAAINEAETGKQPTS